MRRAEKHVGGFRSAAAARRTAAAVTAAGESERIQPNSAGVADPASTEALASVSFASSIALPPPPRLKFSRAAQLRSSANERPLTTSRYAAAEEGGSDSSVTRCQRSRISSTDGTEGASRGGSSSCDWDAGEEVPSWLSALSSAPAGSDAIGSWNT